MHTSRASPPFFMALSEGGKRADYKLRFFALFLLRHGTAGLAAFSTNLSRGLDPRDKRQGLRGIAHLDQEHQTTTR